MLQLKQTITQAIECNKNVIYGYSNIINTFHVFHMMVLIYAIIGNLYYHIQFSLVTITTQMLQNVTWVVEAHVMCLILMPYRT